MRITEEMARVMYDVLPGEMKKTLKHHYKECTFEINENITFEEFLADTFQYLYDMYQCFWQDSNSDYEHYPT